MNAVVLFLLLALQSLAGLEQWRLVYRDGSVETVVGTPRWSAGQRARLDHAWVWSERTAPRRIAGNPAQGAMISTDRERLEVRVVRPAALSRQVPLRVIAAPLPLWTDLPEDLLPSWPVPPGGRLTLPLDPSRPWRLRLAGAGWGSWWLDLPPGRRTALLAPVAAAGIDLAVTGPDGEPLPRATVHLLEGIQGRHGRPVEWALARDADGRPRVPGLPDQDELVLTVIEPDYAPAVLRGRPADLPRLVRLQRGAHLAGRFTDGHGRPVGGVRVHVEAWTSADVPQRLVRGAESRTDGSWSLGGVPPGQVALLAQAPGFAPLRQRFEAAGGANDLGTLELLPGSELAVLAVDDQGTPVAGAAVEAGPGLAAKADARGLARLNGVTALQPLELAATAPRHLAGKARLSPPFPERARIELPRAFTVHGRFVTAAGAPVAEGSVRIQQGAESAEETLEDGGRFELDLPPDEPTELTLASPASRELRLAVSPGAPGEVRDLGDLAAPPGLTVTGRTVDAGTGAPIAGARVWVPRPAAGGELWSWLSRDLLEATSGEDGRFRLEGLPQGPALLRAEAAGHARTHVEATPEAEAAVWDVGDVRLPAGGTIHVTAPDEEAAGAMARLDLLGSWLELDMLSTPIEDGEATFRHVPPGAVTLTVLAGRRLLCERELRVADGEVAEADCSAPPLVVAGMVRVGGAASGPGTLTWLPPGPGVPGEVRTTVSPGGLRQQQVFGAGRPQVDVVVAADGSFSTTDLVPGRWRVLWSPAAGSVSGSQTVDIPRVERFETVVLFPGASVTGVVTDASGGPVEGARVTEIASGALAFSAADGTFSLGGLAPGSVSLQAREGERTSPIVKAEIETGRTTDPIHLILGKGSRVSLAVRVIDAAGAPAAGAFVFLEEEGNGQRILTAAADGRAQAVFDPPYPARVRLAATAGGTWALGPWTEWKAAREGLDVVLGGDPGSLLVVSDSRAGVPQILTGDGWDIAWLFTRLGARPAAGPETPLRIGGLPPGTYTVVLDGRSGTATVRERDEATVRFE